MDHLQTPDSIIAELVHIRAEAQKGVTAQYDAEVKLAKATLEVDRVESLAYLGHPGTAGEKNAQAKLSSLDARDSELMAKAEYNRVKTKLRLLEQAQMSVQTQARLVEMMYRTAGMGER